MRAYKITVEGGRDVLKIAERSAPPVGPTEVLVRVRAAGVNRADILIREGRYPLPTGDNRILGLEVAGEVVEMGAAASGLGLGDRVFGLVRGGGYAEFVAMDMGMAVPVPDGWDWPTAAGVVEAFCTAGETLFELGCLRAGDSVLVHAAGSSVGVAAIQMARVVGARIWFTVGSEEKIRCAAALCGGRGINYRNEDFVEVVRNETGQEGVDVIEDLVGEPHFPRSLEALAAGGRMVLVGNLGAPAVELELGRMFAKRLQLKGFTLRNRSVEDKRAITKRFRDRWLPHLESGAVSPGIHAVVPFTEAAEAHRILEAGENFGKVVLTLD